MTDSNFSFDSSSLYPLPSIGSNPTAVLQLADPTIYQMALFFTQLLNTNLLPRFQNEAAATGLTHANVDNWVDGYAVGQTIVFPLNPSILRSADFKFPLLSIHPDKEAYDQLTLTNVATRRDLVVSWILPPLSIFQYNRMYPFLQLASKVILAYGTQGYDPKVNPLGPSFWKTAGISFGSFHGANYKTLGGLINIGGKDVPAFFPTLEMHLSIWERNQAPVPGNFINFSGVSLLREHLVDGYNPANPINDFIDGYVYPDITLTSCTPSSGTIQGNTLLVIQGTGFNAQKFTNPLQVTVGGAAVKTVTVASPTALLVVTNPGIGSTSYTGNILVLDQAGNSYTLTNGYTYTTP